MRGGSGTLRARIGTIKARLGGSELTRIGSFWVSENLCNSARFDDAPMAHHNNFIPILACKSQIVSDKNQRHPPARTKFAQKVKDFFLSRHVQSGCWFVGDKDRRRRIQCSRNGNALTHATGEFMRIGSGDSLGKTDFAQTLPDPLATFTLRKTLPGNNLISASLSRRQGSEGVLRKPDNALATKVLEGPRVAHDVVFTSLQGDASLSAKRMRGKGTDRAGKHGFACTRLTNDHQGMTCTRLNRHVIDEAAAISSPDTDTRGHQTHIVSRHERTSCLSLHQSPAMLIAVAVMMMARPGITQAAGF